MRRVSDNEPVSQITVINSRLAGVSLVVTSDGGNHTPIAGSPLPETLRENIVRDARSMQLTHTSGVRSYRTEDGTQRIGDQVEVLTVSRGIPDRLIICGAVDYSAALAAAAKLLQLHVTICDARGVFATAERFPAADEIVVDWPHRWLATQEIGSATSICVLTHDPRFDVPALRVALNSRAGYVGAMGSRTTHRDRIRRLVLAGASAEELSRLHSPIGLDLGARTPEETAVSILAEILKIRNDATGQSLARSDGPIHGRAVPPPGGVCG